MLIKFLGAVAELLVFFVLLQWVSQDPLLEGTTITTWRLAVFTVASALGLMMFATGITNAISWFIKRVTAEPETLSITNTKGE